MLNSNLSSPFNRAIFVIIGLMVVCFGVGSLWRIGTMYHNWWKGLVYGPFAIVIGILFIVFTFKLGSLERKSKMNRRLR
ncbi:MAG: hypothetical protein DMG80_19510 [Acidobacteria bacterium]|jgi:hypothetical protein|nr:MAG: hypothetical protein DMG80_19510 [Acidobacteriota bacterium]